MSGEKERKSAPSGNSSDVSDREEGGAEEPLIREAELTINVPSKSIHRSTFHEHKHVSIPAGDALDGRREFKDRRNEFSNAPKREKAVLGGPEKRII
jgi:hypothetical protein